MDRRAAAGGATLVPSQSPVVRAGRAHLPDRLCCALWVAASAAGWMLALVVLGTLARPN